MSTQPSHLPPVPPASAELHNMLCCMEFLAKEAQNAQLPKVYAILKRCIEEIAMVREPHQQIDLPLEFSSVFQAFRFLVRFCLIEDPEAKREIVRLIDSVDKEVLESYAF